MHCVIASLHVATLLDSLSSASRTQNIFDTIAVALNCNSHFLCAAAPAPTHSTTYADALSASQNYMRA